MNHDQSGVGLRRSRLGAVALASMVLLALVAATWLRPGRSDEQTTRSGTQLAVSVVASGSTAATAAVNEESAWGLEIEGVDLRVSPVLDSLSTGGRVSHGEVYEVVCWTEGERVTNGNDDNPTDDATTFTSTLWWKIDGPSGEGFISNVWFARELEGRLNTPRC